MVVDDATALVLFYLLLSLHVENMPPINLSLNSLR